MRKFFIIILFISACHSLNIYSTVETTTFNGATDLVNQKFATSFTGTIGLENQIFDHLIIHGAGNLLHVKATILDTKGALYAKNSTFVTLTAQGGITLELCTITHHATIKGGCTIDNSSFCNLTIYGATKLQNTQVADKTIINGAASILKSHLNELTTTAELGTNNKSSIECIDSTITGSVYIKKSSPSSWPLISWLWSFCSHPKKQQITLTNAIIYGDISFEEGNGFIILQGTSKILGKVTNGTIINE